MEASSPTISKDRNQAALFSLEAENSAVQGWKVIHFVFPRPEHAGLLDLQR